MARFEFQQGDDFGRQRVSSYTVLAHQMADSGITIVPDIDLFQITWHDNGANHFLRWHEFLSLACSDLSMLLAEEWRAARSIKEAKDLYHHNDTWTTT
jgi:hypothetical protein